MAPQTSCPEWESSLDSLQAGPRRDSLTEHHWIIRRIGTIGNGIVLFSCVCAGGRAGVRVCVDNCPSPLPVCATPGCPLLLPSVDTSTRSRQTRIHASEPHQKECLNVVSCTGQLSDAMASHMLPLVGHFLQKLTQRNDWTWTSEEIICQFIIVLSA